jgi:hypothetical protein
MAIIKQITINGLRWIKVNPWSVKNMCSPDPKKIYLTAITPYKKQRASWYTYVPGYPWSKETDARTCSCASSRTCCTSSRSAGSPAWTSERFRYGLTHCKRARRCITKVGWFMQKVSLHVLFGKCSKPYQDLLLASLRTAVRSKLGTERTTL